MKKMPCLFVRVFEGRSFRITEDVTPGCEWVLAGEGVATRKWDGTACMVRDGVLYKRYDAKKNQKTGEFRLPPVGAIPCDDPDLETGHWPHWVPVGSEPESKWHRLAFEAAGALADGTYELCGPHICKSESLTEDQFIQHGKAVYPVERSFASLKEDLAKLPLEGFVFHHPDGRMCKIRKHDFGFAWGAEAAK